MTRLQASRKAGRTQSYSMVRFKFPLPEFSSPSDLLDAPAQGEEGAGIAPCMLCVRGPAGEAGHAALAPDTQRPDRRLKERLWLVFTCASCRARWARERLRARAYRWVRVV